MRLKNALCATLFCTLTGCVHLPPVADMRGGVDVAPAVASTTVPFTLDDNRVFVEVTFIRPDGTPRKALAYVNQGQGGLVLSNALFRELDPHPGRPLRLKIGEMDIGVDGAAVMPESLSNDMSIGLSPFSKAPTAQESARGPGGDIAGFTAPLPVEAVLPAGLLQHFQVVFDYGARTMTLAAPGTLTPQGVAVPIRVNPRTGFAMVDVTIDGARHVFVIDNGGSYSVLRDTAPIVAAHPDWLRAVGAVGEANLTMDGLEVGLPVVTAHGVTLGPLALDPFGIVELGRAPGWFGGILGDLFWSRIYSAKAGERVDGMLAGNVLKSFRLTIDYPNRMSYWLLETPLDAHDLDQVGITLAHWQAMTGIVGIAKKNGVDTVAGVQPGDMLLAIDGKKTSEMTRGQLLAALHGKPGDTKHLTLQRAGKMLEIDVPVTGF